MMGKLADPPETLPPVHSKSECLERLAHWSKVLKTYGSTNETAPREEIVATIDRWLDNLNEIKGR